MADRTETVTVKTQLPPSAQITVGEKDSPVIDATLKEIHQGEGDPEALRREAYKKMTPEERAKRRASIVTALERGVVNDRMVIELPDHLHGEWVRRDKMEIEAMKNLGFKVDDKYATARALDGDGSSASIVHDVVFMVTERENKELIDEVKRERAYAQANPRGPQREEKEFAEKTRRGTEGIIPTYSESKTREAKKEDIAAAMEAMDKQTQPQTLS